jgi:hypothetical protein
MAVDPWKRKVRNEGLLILLACALIGIVVVPPLLVLIASLIF